jgi:hypothetical protein
LSNVIWAPCSTAVRTASSFFQVAIRGNDQRFTVGLSVGISTISRMILWLHAHISKVTVVESATKRSILSSSA